MGRVKRSALAPALRVTIFTLSNHPSTNINKQLSPDQNTPVLQAISVEAIRTVV